MYLLINYIIKPVVLTIIMWSIGSVNLLSLLEERKAKMQD